MDQLAVNSLSTRYRSTRTIQLKNEKIHIRINDKVQFNYHQLHL